MTAQEDSSIEPGITTPFDLAKPYWNDEENEIFTKLWERSEGLELTKSFELFTAKLPDDLSKGWGGRGRVTLIGDAAHAMRPTTGFGTALAFEDVAILCRKLKNIKVPTTRKDCKDIILDFESERLKRVKVISEQQTESAEAAHRGEKSQTLSQEYKEWVYAGI
jgi:2-polyprenyl-6-methoxyphenol hydroxylase-like FAD-dependent oxidoreductase